MSRVSILREFWRLAGRDRLLLLEAISWLALAALAIAALPFRHLSRLALIPAWGHVPPPRRRSTEKRRVRWAIITCARHIPWRAMCFQQGLAAHLMLRRRGIPSVLYYGAAPDNQGGLSAHVWVRDSGDYVVGGESVSRYAVLATFPGQAEMSIPES